MLPESCLSYLPSMELFAEKRAAERAHATLAEVDNCLVNQKDILIRWINDAEEPEELLKVVQYMGFLRPMWAAAKYGYKYDELLARAIKRAALLVQILRELMKGKAKGTKYYKSCVKDIAALNEIMLEDSWISSKDLAPQGSSC